MNRPLHAAPDAFSNDGFVLPMAIERDSGSPSRAAGARVLPA
ncbi:MAG: hypothetical protein ACK54F_02295 [Planctomycetia bacterium]